MITKTIVNLREYANATEEIQAGIKKKRWSRVIVRYISYMLAYFFLLFAMSPVYKADAASLSVKIDGVSSNYTGKQVYVTFDGKKVNMKSTPGIVINGTSYVSYKNVFSDSKIGATATYNSKKKTITIKKYDKTLVMTLGSTSATLNGTTVTMPAAPVKVTYVAKKTTKILVPTEFVTKSLGYGYAWSTTTDTVTAAITTGTMIKYDGSNHIYSGTKPAVIIDDEIIDLSKTLPAVIIDNSVVLQAKKVFTSKAIGGKYKYDKTSKTVKITLGDNVIQMTLGSKTATVNGKKQEMPTAARMITNVTTKKSYVCVPAEFVSNALAIDYRWDSNLKASVITTESDEDEEEDTPSDNTSTENGTTEKPDSNNGSNSNTGSDGNDSSQGTGADSNNGTNSGSNSGSTDSGNNNGSSNTGTDSGNNNGSSNTGTNSGTDTKKVISNYQLLNQYYDVFTKLKNGNTSNFNSTSTTIGYVTGITRLADGNVDREIYMIQSQQPFSNVTSSQTDKVINITASNMMGESTLYPFYNDLLTSVQSVYNMTSMSMDFAFTLTDKNLTYDLSLSADMCTLTVTIYTNYIESIEVGTTADSEYITIKTLKAIEPNVLDSDSSVTLVVSNTTNSVGNVTFVASDLTKIFGMTCVAMNNNDFMMTITRSTKAEYTISKGTDNTYTLTFKKDSTSGNTNPGTSDGSTSNNGTSGNNSGSGTQSGSNSTGATSGTLTYDAVMIPISSGMTLDGITNEDLYNSKKIKIYLPGDQTSTVNTANITTNSSYVSNVEVSYTYGSTVITITTTRICGYDYKIMDGFLCVAIDTPSKVYDKIVVVDPGHGGSDTGAIASTKTYEKDINLAILYTLSSKLFADSGIKTYYTRTTDSAVYLYDRPKVPAQVEADLFISLHMNSATNKTAQGTEVWYYTKETATMNGLTGKMMATTLSGNLSSVMGTTNRGAKGSANLVVLKYNTVPSVLIELGFVSNSSDLAKLESAAYQKKAAESIVATISEFFDEYPTGR